MRVLYSETLFSLKEEAYSHRTSEREVLER